MLEAGHPLDDSGQLSAPRLLGTKLKPAQAHQAPHGQFHHANRRPAPWTAPTALGKLA